jgi:DNA-binding NarL/FixJ family response regulator
LDEVSRPQRVIAIISTLLVFREALEHVLHKAFPDYLVVDGLTHNEPQPNQANLLVVTTSALDNEKAEAWLFASRLNPVEAGPIVLLGEPNEEQIRRISATKRLQGILPDSTPMNALVSGLRFVMDGGTCFPHNFRGLANIDSDRLALETQMEKSNPAIDLVVLTQREHSVLEALSKGMPNKAIATKLDVAENTIKIHVRNVMKKLGAANRTEAVIVARNRVINIKN